LFFDFERDRKAVRGNWLKGIESYERGKGKKNLATRNKSSMFNFNGLLALVIK
jgi:hypothetical protein